MDAELVRRLAADEPSALEEAYRAYGPRCKAVAYRLLQQDASAEDAVQEAFLALWRHRNGLVVRTGGIGPWLYTVTRNAALGILRSESRRSAREERALDVEPGPDPFDEVAADEAARGVRAALAELPAEQRTVITSAYYRAMTLAQIAQQTGAPLGTIKRRAQLGLSKLARALGPSVS
ncbi:MAG: sigma-70 family RNA polymerase sigma factor [Candidatus Eremiobacteraeota bacterium]|nr:sigma-70 family RNA polymerase sigma factor [Candidatus Eremiobacteraeota bacterium]